jgi:arylsulfatase A-like enzyme
MRTVSFALGVVLVSASISCTRDAPQEKPNVVLITADTLRADHLGCYEYFRATSPTIDRLSREGVHFENAFAPLSMTLPSHLSMMTAAYPARHGILSNLASFRRSFVAGRGLETAAEIFSRYGYATAAFTSSSPLSAETGIGTGFSTFHGLPSNTEGRPRVDARAEETVDRALDWLANASGPFFLWVHLFDPHDPYEAPPPFDRAYANQPEVFRFFEKRGFRRADFGRAASFANGYDGEIRYMDGQIDRLFVALRARRLYDGALIVFTADHGEGLLQHQERGHGLIWNEQNHVPLIIKLPGGRRAGRVRSLASSVDVLPTVAAAAGVPLPARLDGVDLLREERESVLVQRTAGRGRQDKQYSLMTLDWKYVYAVQPGEPEALYHLAEDPYEKRNVVEQFPDRAAEMKQQMLALIATASAGAPPDPPGPASPALLERLRQLGYYD